MYNRHCYTNHNGIYLSRRIAEIGKRVGVPEAQLLGIARFSNDCSSDSWLFPLYSNSSGNELPYPYVPRIQSAGDGQRFTINQMLVAFSYLSVQITARTTVAHCSNNLDYFPIIFEPLGFLLEDERTIKIKSSKTIFAMCSVSIIVDSPLGCRVKIMAHGYYMQCAKF